AWLLSVGEWAKAGERGFWATTRLRNSLALLFVIASGVYGQIGASISGRVEDASGSGVGSAKITVTDVETGAARSVTTDESGNYRALSLALGAHEIKVEKTGFKSAVRSGINLEVGQAAVVNFHLEVGEFVQQVTVIDDVPVVNTTTSPVSGIVDERQVKD